MAAGKRFWNHEITHTLIVPFLQFSPRRDLRRKAFDAWAARGANGGTTDNRGIAAEILKLREELAGREALDQQNLRILPVTAEIPAFLDDLNRLAELSGLKMANVQPAPEAADKFFVRVPVILNIQGGYHELSKFFYNISRLERAINMEDIDISTKGIKKREQTEDEGVMLAVTVRATTFRRAEEAQ